MNRCEAHCWSSAPDIRQGIAVLRFLTPKGLAAWSTGSVALLALYCVRESLAGTEYRAGNLMLTAVGLFAWVFGMITLLFADRFYSEHVGAVEKGRWRGLAVFTAGFMGLRHSG